MSNRYLNTRQVAQLLGISLNTLYRWLKAGKIPEPYRNPDNNYRLWTVEAVEKTRYRILDYKSNTESEV